MYLTERLSHTVTPDERNGDCELTFLTRHLKKVMVVYYLQYAYSVVTGHH